MTKTVRIENADMSEYRVLVDIYDRGNGVSGDALVQTIELNGPTQMKEIIIWDGRYLVVREARKEE